MVTIKHSTLFKWGSHARTLDRPKFLLCLSHPWSQTRCFRDKLESMLRRGSILLKSELCSLPEGKKEGREKDEWREGGREGQRERRKV